MRRVCVFLNDASVKLEWQFESLSGFFFPSPSLVKRIRATTRETNSTGFLFIYFFFAVSK